MKKNILIIAAVCAVLMLTGCMTAKEGLSDSGVTTALVPKEYEVLGTIEFDGTIKNVLGFVTWGGKGYEELLAEAVALYPEADAVIDIYKDYKASMILGVYNTWTTSYYGTVIKYK